MRKMILALVLAVITCLTVVSVSAAESGPIQVSGQSADTSQQAAAGSSATQVNPSNTNISIRVLSPGNDGNVSQTNAAGSSAAAGNASTTAQGSDQSAGGGGIQSSTQSAGTEQVAGALSTAAQLGASNLNVPIRVLSPGNDGNVSQTNAVGSQAAAGNSATTSQSGSQTAAGGSCGCSSSAPIQTSDQSASTGQDAVAGSQATQVDPSNTTVSVRVLSPGDGGSVSQTNAVGSTAAAGNRAATSQGSRQSDAAAPCGCSGTSVQQAEQSAGTDQGAAALSAAAQASPSNEASPVRVASDGNGGATRQQNVAGSDATALNGASTSQQGSQSAGSGNAIQVASQDASTDQGALAASAAWQLGASNDASPVRVGSDGNDGSVSQTNAALSGAFAGNLAGTSQNASQNAAAGTCGCGGAGIQVLGQQSDTGQSGFAGSEAVQQFGERSPCGCGGSSGNTASPTRVGSSGDDGTTSQANDALSSAAALNGAATGQNGSQSEAGDGLQIQVLGQQASTEQDAVAASLAAQFGASNDASPVRVLSPGGDGSVYQANAAGSSAVAGNASGTGQEGRQEIAGSRCGCGSLPIQVAGQSAWTGQSAAAFSAALQAYPSNESSPTRVWSPGGGGAVHQANAASSQGNALNWALTGQGVLQAA
jgi:trimeric autotransporter adhesin